MLKIHKKIVTDETHKPIAVQIAYADWLEIERSLNLEIEGVPASDLSHYSGVISLTVDPMDYQAEIRDEWL